MTSNLAHVKNCLIALAVLLKVHIGKKKTTTINDDRKK
jgi:hypothetical protein